MLKSLKTKAKKLRKGQLTLGDIAPIATTLVVAIIVIAVGAMIINNMSDQVNNTTTAWDVMDKGQSALGTFGDWFNIIVIVAVAVIILGLVFLLRAQFSGGRVRT